MQLPGPGFIVVSMDLTNLLANATEDTILHVDYVAGRPISEIAKEEYRDALDWKKSPTSYVGHFVSLKNNKRGEPVLTIFCHNRGEIGKFRAFNPVLGTLRSVTLA